MSGLTKTFVVFVTFLSVVLVALIIPHIANEQNYKEQLRSSEQSRSMAQDRASMSEKMLSDTAVAQANQINALNGQKDALVAEAASSRIDKDKAEARVQELEQENSGSKTQASLLANAVALDVQIIDALRKDIKSSGTQLEELGLKNIASQATITDLQAEKSTLTSAVNHNKEQLVALDEEVNKYKGMIDKLPPAEKAMVQGIGEGVIHETIAETPVRGSVTQLKKVAGDLYVEINVGTKDHVQPNMRFMVYRRANNKDQYLGSLVITNVDTNRSSGQMSIIEPDANIVVGDEVLTSGF